MKYKRTVFFVIVTAFLILGSNISEAGWRENVVKRALDNRIFFCIDGREFFMLLPSQEISSTFRRKQRSGRAYFCDYVGIKTVKQKQWDTK